MPNFPSIYDELQALWRYIRNLQNLSDSFLNRIIELERITQCMDYITSPTNSTVFNCDVRISGSGNPDLYVGPNVSKGNTNPDSELVVIGKTGDAFMGITDGTSRLVMGSTSGASWVGSQTDTDFFLRKNNVARLNITGNSSTGISEIVGRAKITNIATQTVATNRSVLIKDSNNIVENMSFENVVQAGGGGSAGVDVFSTPYTVTSYNPITIVHASTWTAPPGARFFKIICIGGGGGGGGGNSGLFWDESQNENTVLGRYGGGGGGGSYSEGVFRVSDFSYPLKIFVAPGGIGGTGASRSFPYSNSTASSDGNKGKSTFVLDANNKGLCFAGGGSGGSRGENSNTNTHGRGEGGYGQFRGAFGRMSIGNLDYYQFK